MDQEPREYRACGQVHILSERNRSFSYLSCTSAMRSTICWKRARGISAQIGRSRVRTSVVIAIRRWPRACDREESTPQWNALTEPYGRRPALERL
jgi:hypothetical protein